MKMCKKGIAWILALMLVLSMAPSVFAAEGDESGETATQRAYSVINPDANDDSGLYTKKSLVDLGKDGKGIIRLESYVKGKVETSTKPTDIVMVLDVSGSMAYKSSQTQYVEVYASNLDQSKTYYIMQSEGWGKYTYTEVTYKNDGWYTSNDKKVNPKKEWYSVRGEQFYDKIKDGSPKNKLGELQDAVNGFIDITANKNKDLSENQKNRISIVSFADDATLVSDFTADQTELKSAINGLKANGATRADSGMKLAQSQIDNSVKEASDRNRVVIFFTDGEPTSGSQFESSVANKAIDTAKTIKEKATIYSVGIFEGADPSKDPKDQATSKTNKFMQGISSNYLKATKYTVLNDRNTATDADGNQMQYYMATSEASALSEIFAKINEEISVSIELDEKTVVQDTLSKYFNVDQDVDKGRTIKVYTADYAGQDTDGKDLFQTKVEADNITPEVKGKTISVTGFDFSQNYVAVKGDTPVGKKLIIEIPVQLDKNQIVDADSGKWVNSNDVASIVKDGDKIRGFESPQVKLPNIIEVTANTNKKVYDGTELKDTGYSLTNGSLVGTDTLEVKVTGACVDAGEALNKIDSVKVFDKDKKDVTFDYIIRTKDGKLTVEKRSLVLTGKSAAKVYNGSEQSVEGYTVTGGSIADNQTIVTEVAAIAKGTDVNMDPGYTGTITEANDIVVQDKDGKNVSTNYDIKTIPGVLKISDSDIKLTVKADDVEKTYDGQKYGTVATANLENAVIRYMDENGEYALKECPTYKNVGTYTVKFQATHGTQVTTGEATIKINPVELTVTADNKTKTQGEKNPELTGNITGFVNGETAEDLDLAPSYVTEATEDSPAGEYDITVNQNLTAKNYMFKYVNGTLTITEKTVLPTDDKTTPTDNNTGTADKTAKTGDEFPIGLIAGAALLALAGAGAVGFARRRKAN